MPSPPHYWLPKGPTPILAGHCISPQKILEVTEFIGQMVELARKTLDLCFRATVHVKIEFTAQAILRVLAVLAHHDDRRLNRGEHRQKEIEQNERIRIPCSPSEHDLCGGVDNENGHERNDK